MKDLSPHTQSFEREDARPETAFVSFIVLGIVTTGLILWLGFGLFADKWPSKTSEMDDLRNYFWSVGIVAAGIIGIWGFALAAVRTRALDRQAKTAERDSEHNAKKHESEAFAVAIGQLGHEDFAVRLGAIYALEALARTSKNLHGPIFETLCAYVREKAPIANDTEPDVVVLAVLTVIGRRKIEHDPDGFRLDLQSTYLRRVGLQGGTYQKVNLRKANLEGASLIDTHLQGANLFAAHLEGALLCRANLEGANLSFAHLEGVDLEASHLEGANLDWAHLEGACLYGTSFDEKTSVSGVNLSTAILIPAKTDLDFRATVQSSNDTIWPADDAQGAWDRGDGDA